MSTQVLYPLRFLEIIKQALWGGRRLGTVLGKNLGPEGDYAESWEICDLASDQSIVADGPLEGCTLNELVQRFPVELLGRHAPANRFPLLVKFIDACQTLSVQVHPDDEQAFRMGLGTNGKTEAWVILEADAGSTLYVGLLAGVGSKELRQALDEGTVEQCLHQVPVAKGDCLLLPAGTVHAIGGGVLLAEVQQPSDVTFRLFDWNRVDAQGKRRRLHVEEALEVIDWRRGPVGPVHPRLAPHEATEGWERIEELVDCDQFVIRRCSGSEEAPLGGEGCFHAIIGFDGQAVLEHKGRSYPLSRGESILLPAALGPVVCRPEKWVTLLDCTLP